ncbi:MAG: hypothetical protein N2258_06265 [Brevinematales bacterium]|nr:hypothetical protein [Brevinematales bacterium]
MRKFIILFLFLNGVLFAAEKSFMSIGIDSGYLIDGLLKGGWGGGGIFEIKLLDNFSISLDAGYVEYIEKKENETNKISNIKYFGTVRWYQGGAIDGVYAGLGFGSFYTSQNSESAYGYLLPVELGLKLIMTGKKSGFSLEPNATFFLTYGNSKFGFGMKYGVNIGYTF